MKEIHPTVTILMIIQNFYKQFFLIKVIHKMIHLSTKNLYESVNT
jgi:hypothetical protein